MGIVPQLVHFNWWPFCCLAHHTDDPSEKGLDNLWLGWSATRNITIPTGETTVKCLVKPYVPPVSPRNVSFWDYDLDETDLFGDLLWEAPEDDDVVRLGGSCVGRSLVVVQGSRCFKEDLWEANMFSKMYFFMCFFSGDDKHQVFQVNHAVKGGRHCASSTEHVG